ncbi:MAG: hypothetical protein ACR2NM_14120 [Bythopirellula sp.]
MKTRLRSLLTLVIVLQGATALQASSSHDDASQVAYADGWDDGDNGGIGFGPWTLSFDGDPNALNPIYNSDPHFIDGVGVGPLGANLLGAPAFGLTTDNSVSATAQASREFSESLKVGQVFSVDIDGSALEGNSRIGNLFELVGDDGIARYTLRTSLGSADDNWTINGSSTPIDASDALRVSVRLISPDTFSGSVTSLTQPVGNFSIGSPLVGTAGAAITSLRFSTFGTGSSADGARELLFDNIELTRADIIPEPSTWLLAAGFVILTSSHRSRQH